MKRPLANCCHRSVEMGFDPPEQRALADIGLLTPARDRRQRCRGQVGIGPFSYLIRLGRWNEQYAGPFGVRPLYVMHVNSHQFGAPAAGVIGHSEQRCIAQAQFVAATGLEEVRQAHTRGRAIQIGDIALEADRPGLALLHP
jgi:hypothetical protein